MTTRWRLLTCALLASLLAMPAWANSYVYNSTKKNVRVFWTAAGCAGVGQFVCGGSGGDLEHNIYTVCHRESLKPGEGAGRTFPGGTSNRRVHADTCAGARVVDDEAATGNKGDKSRCAARNKSDGTFGLKCGYSKSEFDKLRAGGALISGR